MASGEASYWAMFSRLKQRVAWEVQIPTAMEPFFAVNGARAPTGYDDRRSQQRIQMRVAGLLYHEQPLPEQPRGGELVGFYSLDFSRSGVGLLVPHALYPGEHLRLLLPTMWLIMEVVRCHLQGKNAYVAGGTIVRRADPSLAAFRFPTRESAPSLEPALTGAALTAAPLTGTPLTGAGASVGA